LRKKVNGINTLSMLIPTCSNDGGYGGKSLGIEAPGPAASDSRVFAAKVFFGNGSFLQVLGSKSSENRRTRTGSVRFRAKTCNKISPATIGG
jgi:hypothetical protein